MKALKRSLSATILASASIKRELLKAFTISKPRRQIIERTKNPSIGRPAA